MPKIRIDNPFKGATLNLIALPVGPDSLPVGLFFAVHPRPFSVYPDTAFPLIPARFPLIPARFPLILNWLKDEPAASRGTAEPDRPLTGRLDYVIFNRTGIRTPANLVKVLDLSDCA